MQDFEHKKRQILDRVDILQLVSEQIRLKRNGKRWVGLCCFHSEKTPSFSVNPDQGYFKCFGCGKGGDIFTFVQLRENVAFGEALRILADRAGVELLSQPSTKGASVVSRADISKANAWALRYFRTNLLDPNLGARARQYLESRSVSKGTSETFELGLALGEGSKSLTSVAGREGFSIQLLIEADLLRTSDQGRTYETFRDRLIFPIKDPGGRIIGFGGRTLVDHEAKYLNTRQTVLYDKGRNLYALNLAREAIGKNGRAILVEGYMDCIAAHQAGISETIATLGTALTEQQIELLFRHGQQLVLLFDSDQAGEAAADRAIQLMVPRGMGVRLARIPEGKDPADYLSRHGAEAFRDVLNNAVDALEFKWIQTLERFGRAPTNAERGDAVGDFIRIVAASCETGAIDAIQRGLLVNQVAHLVKLERREVVELMQRYGRSNSQRISERVPAESNRPEVPGPRGEFHAAWSHLLGAVLNEPGLLIGFHERLDFDGLEDVRDRRLAHLIFSVAEELGSIRPSDVLARCPDPEDAARIAEWCQRGADRGNHESTFRVSLDRILQAERSKGLEQRKQSLRGLVDGHEPTEQVSEHLAVLGEGARGHRHFVPRRFLRNAEGGPRVEVDTAPPRRPMPSNGMEL